MVTARARRDDRGIDNRTEDTTAARQPPPGCRWRHRDARAPWTDAGSRGARQPGHPHEHFHRGRRWMLAGSRSSGCIRRSRHDRLLGGVAGGLSARLGIDVTLVRVALVVFGLASGVGVAAYVVAWLLLQPDDGSDTDGSDTDRSDTIASRALSDGRGLVLALAFAPALVVVLVVSSALGAGFVASLGWPALVSAAGLVLIWRNGEDDERTRLRHLVAPLTQVGSGPGRSLRSLVYRVVVGAVLVAVGLFALVRGHPGIRLLAPVGGAFLVAAGFVVVFGPWWLSLARELVSERQARMLAEQRADMAARVHDSVLQTLALIQRTAANPAKVVQLARAQERELRSWLFEGRVPGSFEKGQVATLASGVALIEHQVEEAHAVAVDAITVGDAPLDDRLQSLLEAAREATVNAAKWSGAATVSIFAEVEPERVSVFVRDRGKGFEPGLVSSESRGIAESITGRMSRHGGTSHIRTAPGEGTEVELSMPVSGRQR